MVSLKIIFRKILSVFTSEKVNSLAFKDVTQENWQNDSLVFDFINDKALVCCAEAETVLALVKTIPISLLITDVQMPGKYNGIDLARLIRQQEATSSKPSIPIALHSALTSEELTIPNPEISILEVEFLLKGTKSESIHSWLSEHLQKAVK